MPREYASLYFVVVLEEEFGMQITDEETDGCRTVGELFNYVLTRTADTATPGREVWEKFRKLMSQHKAIPIDQITPESPLKL